mmetsp:Transcript_23450/g.53521  ORF Transcript_23450/g.53521 Transcript_23450/m.53521 type:complete len:208 (-) Transcript_23450:253-876(-)
MALAEVASLRCLSIVLLFALYLRELHQDGQPGSSFLFRRRHHLLHRWPLCPLWYGFLRRGGGLRIISLSFSGRLVQSSLHSHRGSFLRTLWPSPFPHPHFLSGRRLITCGTASGLRRFLSFPCLCLRLARPSGLGAPAHLWQRSPAFSVNCGLLQDLQRDAPLLAPVHIIKEGPLIWNIHDSLDASHHLREIQSCLVFLLSLLWHHC